MIYVMFTKYVFIAEHTFIYDMGMSPPQMYCYVKLCQYSYVNVF